MLWQPQETNTVGAWSGHLNIFKGSLDDSNVQPGLGTIGMGISGASPWRLSSAQGLNEITVL